MLELQSSFHHESLFYEGEEGFLRGTMPAMTAAIAADQPILVAVGNDKIELLKEALGDRAEGVCFTDMRKLGSNPARIIPAWHEFLREHAGDGGSALGIGEPIWSGRSEAELGECERHEWLLNLAFGHGQGWRLLCPYDLDALDDEVIAGARCNHPFITQHGDCRPSEEYLGLHDRAPNPFSGDLPSPAVQPEERAFTGEGLAGMRHLISERALGAGLPAARTQDIVLAVNELATNSVLYAGGHGTLRIWTEADTLLCEVRDGGHFEDPLVGRTRPAPDQPSGRGLWLVNQVCDLVQIRSARGRSAVRVHMRLS